MASRIQIRNSDLKIWGCGKNNLRIRDTVQIHIQNKHTLSNSKSHKDISHFRPFKGIYKKKMYQLQEFTPYVSLLNFLQS
jgi:hypothetical protein